MLKEFPNLSIAVNVSTTLLYSILHDDLHLKPYKFNVWQKLEMHDYQKRVDFAQWFLSLAPDAKVDMQWRSLFLFNAAGEQAELTHLVRIATKRRRGDPIARRENSGLVLNFPH